MVDFARTLDVETCPHLRAFTDLVVHIVKLTEREQDPEKLFQLHGNLFVVLSNWMANGASYCATWEEMAAAMTKTPALGDMDIHKSLVMAFKKLNQRVQREEAEDDSA